MKPAIEIIGVGRTVMKLYGRLCEEVCRKYSITRIELDVLAFLANNPGYDTAHDIVEKRCLLKSHVSLAVEGLMQKGLLEKRNDEKDRRCTHLLVVNADALVSDIRTAQGRFADELWDGISPEDQQIFWEVQDRMAKNASACLRHLDVS